MVCVASSQWFREVWYFGNVLSLCKDKRWLIDGEKPFLIRWLTFIQNVPRLSGFLFIHGNNWIFCVIKWLRFIYKWYVFETVVCKISCVLFAKHWSIWVLLITDYISAIAVSIITNKWLWCILIVNKTVLLLLLLECII